MFLKEQLHIGGGEGQEEEEEGLGQPPPHPQDAAAVGELVASFNHRRMYREVTLALRSALRDAVAEFSFLRLRGLRNLLKSLQSFAKNDVITPLFRQSQSVPELQVVPVLFQNTLKQYKDEPVFNLDDIFGVEPLKISSPAADSEVALALRVLEGCCLLHSESRDLAQQLNAVKVLVNILSTRGALEQGACLDAFIALMLDSSVNQFEFEACRGIEKIAELMKDEQVDESVRLKCGEFVLLLIGHINGRVEPPLATVHKDLRRLLGEKCASLIRAASQFGSTLDPEQRQMVLSIQGRRVLEAVELH
uniref:Cell division control protein 14 n=1 Tax=Anthurium amnicola TaxID=1678845 RepID=A0A1D1YRA8_9ARAE